MVKTDLLWFRQTLRRAKQWASTVEERQESQEDWRVRRFSDSHLHMSRPQSVAVTDNCRGMRSAFPLKMRRDLLAGSGSVILLATGRRLTMPSLNSGRLVTTYMWRGLNVESCERGELVRDSDAWVLRGTILRLSEARPAEARYDIVCDGRWRTRSADVFCSDGRDKRRLRIRRESGRWYANGRRLTLPEDCMDVDLAWSPSTIIILFRFVDSTGSSERTVAPSPPRGYASRN